MRLFVYLRSVADQLVRAVYQYIFVVCQNSTNPSVNRRLLTKSNLEHRLKLLLFVFSLSSPPFPQTKTRTSLREKDTFQGCVL